MQIIIYEILIVFCIILFAIYDIRCKRVSNQALVFFCPAAMAAPIIRIWENKGLEQFGLAVMMSVLGAELAFLILLTAAIVSKGGTGVGGGDIKLVTVMGFIYGPSRISLLLLTASFLAAIAAGVVRAGGKKEKLSLPFVPFLAIGSIVVMMIQISS